MGCKKTDPTKRSIVGPAPSLFAQSIPHQLSQSRGLPSGASYSQLTKIPIQTFNLRSRAVTTFMTTS